MTTALDRRLDALADRMGDVGEKLAERVRRGDPLAPFAKWADDPVGFLKHVLHEKHLDHLAPMADAVRDNRYVAWRSSNGWGKDWLAARLALWWVYARGGSVIVTGPSERQVKAIVMGNVRRAWLPTTLPGTLHELALRVPGAEEAGILAFTSTEASKLTGFHAPRLLAILTEAQACDDFAWEGLLACCTGDESKVLAVANPLTASGKFHSVSQSPEWHVIKSAAADHPNVKAKREIVPGAVTEHFVKLMAVEYGEGSPVYQARVNADFPTSDDGEALCTRAWLERAFALHEAKAFATDVHPPVFSLDVARFGGDENCLSVLCGRRMDRLTLWRAADLMETARKVLTIAAADFGKSPELAFKRGPAYAPQVVVDEPGVGSGAIDRMRELGVEVYAYNGGRAARNAQRFANLRAESYWTLRKRLEAGTLALPRDAKLADELCAMRWNVNPTGKIQIEDKEKLKDRIGRSPDRADSVAMALSYESRPRAWTYAVRL